MKGFTTIKVSYGATVAERLPSPRLPAKQREIQFAADAEWPHTDPANVGIRVEFQLPPDRVMK